MTSIKRVALVTGAGKGLGAAFAQSLAQDGCGVMVNNRSHPGQPSSAKQVATQLQSKGFDAAFEETPVDTAGAAQSIIFNTIERFGQLDVLVLNAGISGPATKIGSGEDAKLRAVMDINFFANTELVEAALPHLRKSDAGRILFIASSAGLYGVRGRAPYAASKAALIAYAKTLAHELARTDIRVNVLAPYAATAMTSTQDTAIDPALLPENAAAAATWLARPNCDRNGEVWMSGANYFARAGVVEGEGGGDLHADPDWFGAHVETLSVIEGGTECFGAEQAFAQFFKKAKNLT